MKNYADFYAKITDPIRKNPRAVHSLRLINRLLTAVMYLVYPLLLIYLFVKQQSQLIPAIFIPGVSFILVSLMRKMINVPRPYEAWQINPLIQKDTQGQSMPSRHVFSASIISMAVLTQSSFLGVILLILSLVIAFCRVLGGVHYLHDVVAGYLIGLICGFLLFLF
ncbi:phosphatase PAP2 family protein [Streptococcus infantarius]|uniref:phosphatase PAP2 family protein n=1 Tax=Streptococcus infantarius TaxID=102684 RepID=UPI00208E3918|nr:phosphatase PAP2 family protein [Streptococcus infantarius]MCO4493708.1 Membrane-associated phospholipid phosphatase [Streptococcus infantarius subsp. infantarius]MCO4501172.1 Membrane-associated phospholipid phosphatase [Streptococcus infantarius subsp. infantarius]MCY7242572.1 phosphatase PAP2 family protein [Streptococcus infantarius]